jgi:hypothetical protein
MSNTRVMSAERDENLAPSLRIVLPNLIFKLLIVFQHDSIVPPHHVASELQAFMLAKASRTPPELFAKLKYEGHPGLWHLLLWVITRFTDNPMAMQVLHLAIALGIWVLVWRVSPFRSWSRASPAPCRRKARTSRS